VAAECTKFFLYCYPLIPLNRFLDLLSKLFLHCYAAVGKILTDNLRRAVAELLALVCGMTEHVVWQQ